MALVWLLAHPRLYDLMALSYPLAQLHKPVYKINIQNPFKIPYSHDILWHAMP